MAHAERIGVGQRHGDRLRRRQVYGDGLGDARGVLGAINRPGGDGVGRAVRLVIQVPGVTPGRTVEGGIIPIPAVNRHFHRLQAHTIGGDAGERDAPVGEPVGGSQHGGGDGDRRRLRVHGDGNGLITGLHVAQAILDLWRESVASFAGRCPGGSPQRVSGTVPGLSVE